MDTNKHNVNVIAYYMSRHVPSSYNNLGFKNRTEAHLLISQKFGVKSSYVKNMEDGYDSVNDNHRRGWWQRELRPAQANIVEKYSTKSEEELFALVKSILDTSDAPRIQYDDFGEAPDDDVNQLQMFAKKIRKGQPQFRRNLLQKYDNTCAVTGTRVTEVLEAAHIYTHSESGINHSSNGILLRSDIHNLFDSGMIKINPETKIIELHNELISSDYNVYAGKIINKDIDG